MPRWTDFKARRTRASSGGSSHNGGGKPSRMGGIMGVRKSFFQQYFSSRRSAVQGGTRMGVNRPIEKGQQPLNPNGASADRASTRVRTFLMPLPLLPRSWLAPPIRNAAGATGRSHLRGAGSYAKESISFNAENIGWPYRLTLAVRQDVSRSGVKGTSSKHKRGLPSLMLRAGDL